MSLQARLFRLARAVVLRLPPRAQIAARNLWHRSRRAWTAWSSPGPVLPAADSAPLAVIDRVTAEVMAEVDAERLEQEPPPAGAWAMLSILRPADSGCANFSSELLAAPGRPPIDAFFPCENLPARRATWQAHPACSQVRLAAAGALRHLRLADYEALFVPLGNSNHHVDVLMTLRQLATEPGPRRVVVEIHDPFLTNLARQRAARDGIDFLALLDRLYPEKMAGLASWRREAIAQGWDGHLVESGITGLAAVLENRRVDLIVAHSKAAAEWLAEDAQRLTGRPPVALFHPVFPPFRPRPRRSPEGGLRLGVFGVPSGAKRLELVWETYRRMKARGEASALVVAGYHATSWITSVFGTTDGLEVEDNPDNDRLYELMRSVDVAFQLRSINTGESSGIVPMLLANDVPVICNPIGAFAEYGEAVAYVSPTADAEELAEVVRREAVGDRQAARRAYVESHSPEAFWRQLRHAVEALPAVETPVWRRADDQPDAPRREVVRAAGGEARFASPEPALTAAVEGLARDVEARIARADARYAGYLRTHYKRYVATGKAVSAVREIERRRVLEIGRSEVLDRFLAEDLGFEVVDATVFRDKSKKESEQPVDNVLESNGARRVIGRILPVNIEEEPLPVPDDVYDLILCCEVIEHMDVDPMFPVWEMNRALKKGGVLFLTTPNVTSAENIHKILHGYAPQLFMLYTRDRDPYRHNLEYDPHLLRALLEAGGFFIERMWTENVYFPDRPDLLATLSQGGYPTDMRGDNLFVVARKAGPPRERHPAALYA